MATTDIEYPNFEAELAAIDYTDLEQKYTCALDENYGNILIIDHLPIVDASKEEKLLAVIKKKFFGPAAANLVEGGVFMPKGEDGMSKGYGFFEFENVDQAEAAYVAVHGIRLDKSHQLYAIRFNDFDRLAGTPDEFVAPAIEEYKEKEFLKDWLSDPMARDQFATLTGGNCVQVCWGPRNGPAEVVEERKPWTDAYIQWSPKGSYLATVHGPGVMLWGGKSWSRLGRFSHEQVKYISFSPDETFLVTLSLPDQSRPTEHNMLIWDIHSGVLVRGMVMEISEEKPLIWPAVRFSANDRYAAWPHNGLLSIYETENGFKLLDGKAMEIPGIRELCWSPSRTDNRLVYWVPETENTPARVALIEVPSRLVLRTKNLFNVDGCSFHWQSNGDYLAVQVNRFSGKNKKTLTTNLELFRLREKNIPVEVVEFKDTLKAVQWEPNGDRFLAVSPAEFKCIINLYTMKGSDGAIKLNKTIERKQVDRFFWSPAGTYLIMADLGSTNAFLEFWNANEMTLMATKEHFLATNVEWDPSGRYVTSFVSAWKQASDNGYCIWDMKGELITKQNQPKFYTFIWRPRPASLLSAEKQKEIKKNYKTYATQFEAADLRASNMESSDTAAVRLASIRAWNNFRERCKARVASLDAKRKQLLTTTATSGEPCAEAEEWVEEVFEETEEQIQ